MGGGRWAWEGAGDGAVGAAAGGRALHHVGTAGGGRGPIEGDLPVACARRQRRRDPRRDRRRQRPVASGGAASRKEQGGQKQSAPSAGTASRGVMVQGGNCLSPLGGVQ